ncbi:DUF6361 family protein [Azospirillum melinis]
MSIFAWLDRDSRQSEAINRLVASLKQPEARDELGLGGYRDGFADLFFPGTSTIQTRLRYMLFVPWCCRHVAATLRRDRTKLAAALRETEAQLIECLRHLGPNQGVIGRRKGADLANMPSSIYWSGLRSWGIARMDGSAAAWPDMVLAERQAQRAMARPEDGSPEGPDLTLWDPGLPEPPKGFLTSPCDFVLTGKERAYLLKRIDTATVAGGTGAGSRHSLLGIFARHPLPDACRDLWDHPACAALPSSTRDWIEMARIFSAALYGAVLLYNLLVAQQLKNDGVESADQSIADFQEKLADWQDEIDPEDIQWLRENLPDITVQARALGHGVTDRTVVFVEEWLRILVKGKPIARESAAADLVVRREIDLKRNAGTSRFQSEKARRAWGGESGGKLTYRWNNAHRYLQDLIDA